MELGPIGREPVRSAGQKTKSYRKEAAELKRQVDWQHKASNSDCHVGDSLLG